MAAPELPIEVDPETGVWTTDSLPMLYVPRHFFVNNHLGIEAELGPERYAEILYEAGYKSAWHWCEKEAAAHGLAGWDVFHHYMKRLSQRGWGLFSVLKTDEETGRVRVRLDNSAFVLQIGQDAGRKVCHMFTGWFPGSLEWVGRNLGHDWQLTAAEVQCAAEGHDHCIFETWPRD